MKFYDSQIFTNLSVGEDSLEKMAETAKALGYSTIVIADLFQGLDRFKLFLEEVQKVKVDGLEIITGVTIEAKTVDEMKNVLSKVRDKVFVVIVNGGDYAINRAVVEDSRVDILMNPHMGRIDSGLDEACLNFAKQNGIAIGINFRPLLKSFRRQRSLALQNISTNLELCKDFKIRVVGCSGAMSKWDMRDPRQLVAIANSFGLDLGSGFSALTGTPLEIIEKNRKILAGEAVKGAEVI
jgi:ribonuclease P/MRP protein subunit RPP1